MFYSKLKERFRKRVLRFLGLDIQHQEIIHSLRQETIHSLRVVGQLISGLQSQTLAQSDTSVSVLVPVHNRPLKLYHALSSIIEQNYKNIEVILIDDGSSPSLKENHDINKLIQSSSIKINFVRIEHSGSAKARNIGIALAKGDLIAFLDSDNSYAEGYISSLVKFYDKNEPVQIGFAAMLWDDGDHSVQVRHDDFSWEKLFNHEVNLDINCISFRRRVYEELGGFNETLTRLADFDLLLRYTQKYTPSKINALSAFYFSGNESDRITISYPLLPNYKRICNQYKEKQRNLFKVLIYSDDYPQLSETYIDTEIDWFVRQGIEIEVYSCRKPGAPGVGRVKVHTGSLDDAIGAFNPDLIHAHWLNLGKQVSELIKQYDIPITVRGHGYEFNKALINNLVDDEKIKSIYTFPTLIKRYIKGKVSKKIIPTNSCFNSNRFFPSLTKDKGLVLRAGACLPTKNIDAFIQTASQCSDYKFVLALTKVKAFPDMPKYLIELNESLGSPVEIIFNVGHLEMTELVAKAGVYMHTFGFQQPFGMPVSIIESMATGAICLLPDTSDYRSYAGDSNLFYKDVNHAVHHLNEIKKWDKEEWLARSIFNSNHAYDKYMDDDVLNGIYSDWKIILGI